MNETDHSTADEDVLVDLQQIALRVAADVGISDEQATEIANQIVEFVRFTWGGQQIYVRKYDPHHISDRDIEIYTKFNGKNHTALAREYNLTPSRVYRIVKVVGRAERERRQHQLFEES